MVASVLIAISLGSSSCSLGSMPSRTSSSDSSSEISESETTALFDPTGSSESVEDTSLSGKLMSLADQYMDVLRRGDAVEVAEHFRLTTRDILSPVFECYEEVFRVLFTDVDYSYGALFTTDYTDYSLEVTCKIPDIKSCVSLVLEDTEFMDEVTKEWVIAIATDYSSQDATNKYNDMVNNILEEALRRIKEGEFDGKELVTGSFQFHDNGNENWICSRTPEFVKICTKDNYMWKLIYIDPTGEYKLIECVGGALVTEGTIKQKDLDNCLELKMKEIVGEE